MPDRHHGATSLKIAMLGTRGVPAAYGGFETAVEEVGARLVERGHRVAVYTRGGDSSVRRHRGMRVVHLPAIRQKQLETLSHTGISVAHAIFNEAPDAAFVFNAANAPFLPALRARGIPAALHMDGLEWRRAKWGPRGRAYYRWAEFSGVRLADALIADAPGIADYYRHQFDVPTELLRYGAPVDQPPDAAALAEFGVEAGGFHVAVARFEPENHVLEIVDGYRNSSAQQPLVVVGAAPYNAEYTRQIAELAGDDPRIRLVGAVYDQPALDALYSYATTYLHGHSVGGTNPSLLRAMGAGTPTLAWNVGFNREVLGGHGWLFDSPATLAAILDTIESDHAALQAAGAAARDRAAATFDWDAVAVGYEDLAYRLASGYTIHPFGKHARRNTVEWSDDGE